MNHTSGQRKKLLVIAGAGAALDFGMPSVNQVHQILLEAAAQFFPLLNDPAKNLYGYLHDEIKTYWSDCTKQALNKTPNFEDVLYAVIDLASTYPAGIFTSASGAFVAPKIFPEVLLFGRQAAPTDAKIMRSLVQHLVDTLIDDFRARCRNSIPNMNALKQFFGVLTDNFEVAVATTNYDDLIYQCMPGIETGFDSNGLFEPGRIVDRPDWACLLHMHGSVHFDMEPTNGNLHGIRWQDDLNKLHQNSFGRSGQNTVEGHEFPTSSIIAGYGKTEQIQRFPFRTYYSELDRLVHCSDAVLFLGFSLVDAHIRMAFENYRDSRNRPVVFIDYADDNAELAGNGHDSNETGPLRVMRVFDVHRGETEWLGHKHPDTVEALKNAHEFERCSKQDRRLSIWYGGMLEACKYAAKVVTELKQ